MAAYAIQFRRGTTTQHSSFTGLLGEVTVDTDKSTVVVHDGSTAGGFALALEGAAVSTTTGAFTSNVTVDGSLTVGGGAAITGALTMTGHVLPSADVTYDLGSSTKQWKDIYVGPGSLYVNGKKVIEDDSGSINITTDNNEDLMMSTTGTGTIKLRSANGINLTGELGATSGDIQIGDHVDMNSSLIKELGAPVSGTDATNKTYVDATAASAVTGGSNAGAFTNVTVSGNLTVTGTTTTINSTNVEIGDNIIALNADVTGSPTENAGIDVERGDSLNVQLLWDETNDRWTVGSEDMVAATFIGDLTGDVTGTVSSIANHLLDEDNMATNSATKIPSQQSVKAYVDSQVATIDNTDEMTEGSTNLYFTNARADARIAAADTDDLSEGSSNLYYTNARADARIAAVLVDSDSMAGHSATSLASGESIKAYVDAADTAQTTSINTAWAAADTAQTTSINTAWAAADSAQTTALQTYADTAEADAISTASTDATTKANAAQAAAIADSDAENLIQTTANKLVWEAYADQAEADAISTAAADATSKADAAEADAISTAAADATSKANAAQAAAIADSDAENTAQTAANKLLWEAYADQAEADAESAAAALDTTQTAANKLVWEAYADQAEADAESAAASLDTAQTAANKLLWEAYADQAEADAESAAASDATTKANAALSSAQSYADTAESDAIASAESKDVVRATAANAYADAAVAALVDSAPTSLNTLNELAAAIADDASYSSTLTTLVGTKLSLSGGAMTGAITTNSTFDGRDVASDGTKLDGIASGALNNPHPSYNGDDFSVDTGALTGATIVSDIDINVTSDTNGHVTDANGSVSTRTLTLADLGYTGSGTANDYTHPTHPGDDFSLDTGHLTGATVIDDIDINVTTDGLGHVTDANGTVATRVLTLADLGYTGATNANYITNNNQLTNGAGYITGYTNTTYTAGNGLGLSGTVFSMDGQYSGNFVVSGDITAQGGDLHGQATTAKYADLAERYAADASYEEGTVVMFGGEAEVTAAQGYGSTKIAGVVSTKPGFAMNAEAGNSETHPYIALQGRVPCKVTGTVSKGDILVASEVSGIATVWTESTTDPRMTAYVGIAIEDKTSETTGYIEVKVGK